MPRNEGKMKSGRKALKDLSNKNHGGRSSKSMVWGKKALEKGHGDRSAVVDEDDALDRLLLVQSDLSSLIHKIDELVAQTFTLKATGKQGKKEIESFTHFLSEMQSSLKPWFPRLQKVLSGPSMESENHLEQTGVSKIVSSTNEVDSNALESPEECKSDSLISPSPLVSWRANCTIERGRQLFLLTPLPISKALSCKHQAPSKSVFGRVTSNAATGPPSLVTFSGDMNDSLLECVPTMPTYSKPSDSAVTEGENTLQPGFPSPPASSKRECSMLVMTPCLKMSPPKSCVLLEPISEVSHRGNYKLHKSTPFPVGICSSELSESSGGDDSEGLAFKYPELLGIQQAYKPGLGKKRVESSPDWFVSPPKTCVLLNPPDDESSEHAAEDCQMPITAHVLNQQVNSIVSKENNVQCSLPQVNKSCNREPVGGNIAFVDSTPMWKEPESTIRRGKLPGENTLKKELWTRFEAASTYAVRFNVSTAQNTAQKGFLDLLDEASCDEGS